MPTVFSARAPALAAVFLLITGAVARADKIDGDWCNGEGGHFSIQGPHITTESGRALEGHYYRHAFSYTIPAPEAGAGQDVQMVLRDETTVDLRVGPAGEFETWRRCDVTS